MQDLNLISLQRHAVAILNAEETRNYSMRQLGLLTTTYLSPEHTISRKDALYYLGGDYSIATNAAKQLIEKGLLAKLPGRDDREISFRTTEKGNSVLEQMAQAQSVLAEDKPNQIICADDVLHAYGQNPEMGGRTH